MRRIYFALLILTGTTLATHGEEFRTDINPALLYYRALLVAPEPMSDVDRSYLESRKGREDKLPERFGKIVADYDGQFQLIHQAAHSTVPCDWGIDLSPGPSVTLPHLGRLKAVSRTAQLRAIWALQHGRQMDARDELLAAFIMGRNAASDGLLISAFVQYVIEGINHDTVAQYFGEFAPETLKQLVAGYDTAPASHTVASSMASEKGLGDWILRKVLELQKAHPADDAKVMADFRESGIVAAMEFLGETNWWSRLVAASGGTSAGVVKLLRELEPLFPRLTRIMALPQPEFEIESKQLSEEIHKSQNPFLAGFRLILDGQKFPFRARECRAQAQLAMVHAAVEYRLEGESGLQRVTDPFGHGPFSFRRFVFKGVDRGFELKSAYAGAEAPLVMIFVEKRGPAFEVSGPNAGKAIEK